MTNRKNSATSTVNSRAKRKTERMKQHKKVEKHTLLQESVVKGSKTSELLVRYIFILETTQETRGAHQSTGL